MWLSINLHSFTFRMCGRHWFVSLASFDVVRSSRAGKRRFRFNSIYFGPKIITHEQINQNSQSFCPWRIWMGAVYLSSCYRSVQFQSNGDIDAIVSINPLNGWPSTSPVSCWAFDLSATTTKRMAEMAFLLFCLVFFLSLIYLSLEAYTPQTYRMIFDFDPQSKDNNANAHLPLTQALINLKEQQENAEAQVNQRSYLSLFPFFFCFSRLCVCVCACTCTSVSRISSKITFLQ